MKHTNFFTTDCTNHITCTCNSCLPFDVEQWFADEHDSRKSYAEEWTTLDVQLKA